MGRSPGAARTAIAMPSSTALGAGWESGYLCRTGAVTVPPPGSQLAVLARAAASLLVLGCASAPGQDAAPAALPREEVLERGGELGHERPERALEVTAELVRVWGISEVPDGSRLQLALSGVDAITRTELLKAVRVRVQALLVDVQSSTSDGRSLSESTTESVSGVLDRAGPLPHGWARIRRGERVVLRLWARLEVRRATLEDALRAPLGAGLAASELVSGLTLSAEATP
jgi:hypothetical protein